jgi:HlyD family secretion protein
MLFRITKRRIFWLLACIVFVGAIGAGYAKFQAYRRISAADRFRTSSIRRGDIKFEVKCTGTIQPVLSVQVGSYVSGPVLNVCVDFNDNVKKGQLLAEIDPLVYMAQCRQGKATLAHSTADLEQFKAKLNQTERDFKRAEKLHEIKDIPGLDHFIKGIADSDFDLAKANFEMATANVEVAKASVEQNRAALDAAETNLTYTSIRSPVDGLVIDRKVDAGQTLASQFQTPVMFVVAPDLEKKIHILASVDEADIGLVRKAELNKQPVQFTVDAYPDEPFEGKITQVRLGPKAAELNVPVTVVTYTAVVEAPNAELKLLPGMTANLIFQIDKHDHILKIPNAALRFHPRPEYVHPKHLVLLEGLKMEDEPEETAFDAKKNEDDEKDEDASEAKKKSDDKAGKTASDDKAGKTASDDKKNSDDKADKKDDSKNGKKKYVWIIDGDLLSPVEVKVGISDSRHTELISGDLKEKSKVVTGMKTAAEAASAKPSQ